jgi:hypothetical protein
MEQKDLLKHFVANTLDVYSNTVISNFLINNKINLDILLNHSILKLNVLFTDFWNELFGSYPSKKDFQDLVGLMTPLEKCFDISIDFSNATTVKNILNIILKHITSFNVVIGNEAHVMLQNCVKHCTNAKHIDDVIKAKWSYRFNNKASKSSEKLLNCFLELFINQKSISSSYQYISNFIPKDIHFDVSDDSFMSNNEKTQYILYRDNRFLVQLASHYLIVSVGCPEVPKYILDAVYSVHKKNVVILYIDRKDSQINHIDVQRFAYDISLDTYKMIPRVAQNMLLVTSKIMNERPLCKTPANCILYDIAENDVGEECTGDFGIILSNKPNRCNPQRSIYYMPNGDFDSVLMNDEVKKTLLKSYISHNCPFKNKNVKNNVMLFTNFIAIFLMKNIFEIENLIRNNKIANSEQNTNVVCIVDTRFNMLTLISALVSYFNTVKYSKSCKWELNIYTSKQASEEYKHYIQMLQTYCIEIHLLPELECSIFHMEIYNQILKSAKFWKDLDDKGYKKCLIVQDDGMLVNGTNIESYMDYDYVGAPWLDVKENEYIKKHVNKELVGNGGFSLRDVKRMKEVCDTFIQEKNQLFYHNINEIPEDVYFVECLVKMGAKIAPFNEARKFAVEQVLQVHPMGFHKFWSYHHPETVLHIFNSILQS